MKINIKKFFNLLLSFVFLLGFVLPIFSNVKIKDNKAKAIINESEIAFIQDIVSTNNTEMSLSLRANAVLNQTPFNKNTNAMMEGYSITPTADKNNEIRDVEYEVIPFALDENKSVFMWIYLPDSPNTNLYNLKISFTNEHGNSSITWEIRYDKLYEIISTNYQNKYGWKLFEFTYKNASVENYLGDASLSKMRISYYFDLNLEDYLELPRSTNGKLSFYHIYLGGKMEDNINVALSTEYVNYKMKKDFESEFTSLCLNDVYIVKELQDIFEYIFVGKYNLLLTGSHNNLFQWEFYINNGKGRTDVVSGYDFKMDTEGLTSFNIQLTETRSNKEISLFNNKIEFNCSNYSFGGFTQYKYELIEEEVISLSFKLKDGFKLTGKVKIESSDEEIFKVNSYIYDEKSKIYIVKITGLKKGVASIVAKAEGSRPNKDEDQFQIMTKVYVSKKEEKFFNKKTVIITVAFYGTTILIFGIFTFINMKRAKKLTGEQTKEKSKN